VGDSVWAATFCNNSKWFLAVVTSVVGPRSFMVKSVTTGKLYRRHLDHLTHSVCVPSGGLNDALPLLDEGVPSVSELPTTLGLLHRRQQLLMRQQWCHLVLLKVINQGHQQCQSWIGLESHSQTLPLNQRQYHRYLYFVSPHVEADLWTDLTCRACRQ